MSKSDMPSKADESAFLADPNIPEWEKQIIKGGVLRHHKMYAEAGRAMRAKVGFTEALIDDAFKDLELARLRGEAVTVAEWRQTAQNQAAQLIAYEVAEEESKRTIEQLKAAPALAVHSED